MVKMRMKTNTFGMKKYTFRAKVQKISQLKFGCCSKTVTLALLLYSSMPIRLLTISKRDIYLFFDYELVIGG